MDIMLRKTVRGAWFCGWVLVSITWKWHVFSYKKKHIWIPATSMLME